MSSARSHASTTWLVVHPKGRDGDGLTFPTESELTALSADKRLAHRLGVLDDTDAFALPLATLPPAPFGAFYRTLAGFSDIGESLEETLLSSQAVTSRESTR